MSTKTTTAPTVPARPSWATTTAEPETEGENGNWSVEYSAFVGEFGTEVVEIIEHHPDTDTWTVRMPMQVLLNVDSLDTTDDVLTFAADMKRVASIVEGEGRPVGTLV
ncbi:hypothetical protein NKG05_26060 [Oerskovia sp. M15]